MVWCRSIWARPRARLSLFSWLLGRAVPLPYTAVGQGHDLDPVQIGPAGTHLVQEPGRLRQAAHHGDLERAAADFHLSPL